MRTDDLICMMAKTPPCSCAKRNMRIWLGVALLFAGFVAVVGMTLGFRPDLGLMWGTPEMLFKYAVLAAAAVGSGLAWWYSGHPLRSCRVSFYGLILLGAFLASMAVHTLLLQGGDAVGAILFDRTALVCIGFIAAFAGVGSFVLMRIASCMAPVNCRLHAFMTGLFAASLGALAYGLHCKHDHPAYVALWYGGTALAFTIVALGLIRRRQAW